VGERNRTGGPQALCLQRVGERNRETSQWALGDAKHPPLVSVGQVGVGRRYTSEAGAHGLWQSCVPFSWAGSPEEVGGGVWPGGALVWAVGPDLALQITFCDLSFYSVHVLSAAAF